MTRRWRKWLALLPVLALLFWLARRARARALRRFGHPDTMERIMPDMSRYKHALKFILLLGALLFLVMGCESVNESMSRWINTPFLIRSGRCL